MNTYSQLDAQSAESRLAHVTHAELASDPQHVSDYNGWLDEQSAHHEAGYNAYIDDLRAESYTNFRD